MPAGTGAIVYNVPGSEKTIIAGKSTGACGHMLQLNYEDNYLRLLRYYKDSWKTTNWEKISAGYSDEAGKWSTARTITLTGSVTGSVSIDGSANVTLATTTNHTHNFDSITSKPTTIGGYGITDAYTKTETNTKLSGYLPLTGGTIDGRLQIGTNDNTSYKYLMLVRNSHFIRINNTDLNAHFTFGTMSDTGSLTDERILTLGDNGLRFSPNNSVYYDILHSGNYNAYSPKLDGTGATGT